MIQAVADPFINTIMTLRFDNRFVEQLPSDPETDNYVRQVGEACYSFVTPLSVQNPKGVLMNTELAKDLGIQEQDLNHSFFAEFFSGKSLLEGMEPYAMCYGGHQFGNWAGQLGDGRAINLGEAVTKKGNMTLQLKGAGMTPYSRHADGMAVLRSSVREFLCSEAMHHLGVPTTRALSLVLSGDLVERDMFYDGNAAMEQGAVVCRVSPSFIRFGSFEIFSARKDKENLQKLVDFCIENDYPEIDQNDPEKMIVWFKEIAKRTCDMIVHWQRVGFVHGVMNTDNMSILGLTIDYGPYGWIDNYDTNWTPNTTDLPGRRYSFGNQAKIAHWNLFKLAQAIALLCSDEQIAELESTLNNYPAEYETHYLEMMSQKLGLDIEQVDAEFTKELEEILQETETDMTLFFRKLMELKESDDASLFEEVSYLEDLTIAQQTRFNNWLEDYAQRINKSTLSAEKN